MKVKVMHLFTLTLLFCLLLTAIACGKSPHPTPENTPKPLDTTGGLLPPDDLPSDEEDGTEVDTALPAPPENPEIGTDMPVYPGDGDIDIDLPELQEDAKIILSVKDGKVLGASSLDKPTDSDIIDNLSDFQKLYGTVEGIDESFFESNVLRLVHTAQSSGSTRYAVESVILEDGRLKVEIIEQHAAISTRDLRYWYVFIAVEKDLAEVPVDVNVTGIQLAG